MAWQDDPKKDYRKRYRLPEHWILTDEVPFAVDYEGYIEAALNLLPAPNSGGTAVRLLDAGCGDGFVASKMQERGYNVTGVDYSDRAIGFARIIVEGIEFHCLDLRDLNTREEWKGAFDAVFSVEVLEHIPVENQLHVCRNLAWALRDGGRLVISVPSTDIRGSYTHYKHFTVEEIKALLAEAGFEVEEIVYQNKLSIILSKRLWKLMRNNIYDLVWMRRLVRKIFLRNYNIARPGQKVGRFILACRKPGPA